MATLEHPDGWEKVASRSRPGQSSFKYMKTGDVYDSVPAWAWKDAEEVVGEMP